jgi:hypothetical protein
MSGSKYTAAPAPLSSSVRSSQGLTAVVNHRHSVQLVRLDADLVRAEDLERLGEIVGTVQDQSREAGVRMMLAKGFRQDARVGQVVTRDDRAGVHVHTRRRQAFA